MKLWIESVWDWLVVARTNRKSNNKNRTKMKPVEEEQNENVEEEETQNEERSDDKGGVI